MTKRKIEINRAPVLTLWASVVAERLGFAKDEALSLGKGVAGLTAQSKGRRLGIYQPVLKEIRKVRAKKHTEEFLVDVCGRGVPAINTKNGVRAVNKGKPVEPEPVERYLASKFGEALEPVRQEMRALAKALKPDDLRERGFRLYEKFRPSIPEGVAGWGAKGELDLNQIRSLAAKK